MIKVRLNSIIYLFFRLLFKLILFFLFLTEINLLNIYLPLLVSLLSERSGLRTKSYRNQLHVYALQKLTSIGPKYPLEFRQVIGSVPKFRITLENAIRNQQTNAMNDIQNVTQNNIGHRDNPSIKLKVDFSNYTEKN
jgi:hypothetical protein